MQKDRKKEHKKVLKDMRRINRQIENDEYLGLNRFRIDIVTENWHRFVDGSGGFLHILFKITDKLTNNKACFMADNYNYWIRMNEYANDFLIRCSSGHMGHFPPLLYAAYDVHEIVPYREFDKLREPEDGVIDTYNWLKFDVFK